MTVNMILMLMRTHIQMKDGTSCTETTMILMTMKTVLRSIPLKCQMRMTLLPFWIYPQLKRGDIMDDNNEAADTMTKIDMTGGHTILHEVFTTVKVNKVAHNTNPHDGKNMIIQMARCDDMHMDEDTKYVHTSNRHDAYEAACKMDVERPTQRPIPGTSEL